jgi:hypothetical protein
MMGDLLRRIGDALNLAFSGRHRVSVRDWTTADVNRIEHRAQ